MANHFDKFKKKVQREHLVKSLICSLVGGLVVAGVSIMSFALGGVKVNPTVHVAFGVVAAGAVFALFYKFAKPSDKKIAARMDAAFQGNEKYLTMVEYQDKEGLIIEKQREDAQQELEKKSPKALPLKLSVWNIPALILAGGFFTASCFTPQIKQVIENNIPADNPFDDIHNDINSGGADDGLKDDLNDIINKVEDDINNGKDPDEVIDDAKDAIDDAVDNVNSKEEIGDELIKSEDPLLKELGEAIKAGDQERVDKALQAIYVDLSNYSSYKLANRLEAIADEIDKALNRSGIPEGDPLRDDLQKLADKLREIAKALKDGLDNGEDNSDQAKDNIKDAVDEAKEDINKDLDQQNKNQEAGETAKDALDQMKDPTQNGQNGNSGDQEGSGEQGSGEGEGGSGEQGSGGQGSGNQGNSGNNGNNGSNGSNGGNGVQDGDPTGEGAGGGDGSVKYPGNDHVYTDQGDTKYGDVIDGSNGDAQDDCDQNGDDDINAALKDYFDELYGDHNKNNP